MVLLKIIIFKIIVFISNEMVQLSLKFVSILLHHISSTTQLPPPPPITIIIISSSSNSSILLICEFFTLALADGFLLEFEWQQVSTS